MFLRVNLENWNIIRKYFRLANLSGLSVEDKGLEGSGLKLIFHWRAHLLISFESVTIISRSFRFCNGRKRNGLLANNLGLH